MFSTFGVSTPLNLILGFQDVLCIQLINETEKYGSQLQNYIAQGCINVVNPRLFIVRLLVRVL
jgi:hypothetical protein